MESQLTMRLPADLAAKLARSAKQQKRKRSEVVRAALEQYLNTEPNVRPIEQVRDLLGSIASGRPDLGQIVISKQMRQALGLKPGDQLAALVESDRIILRPKPKNPAARLRGIGKGTWGDRTKIDAYLDKLRDEWQRA